MLEDSLESTYTHKRFHCPACGSFRVIPTTTGKVAQVAPLASAAAIIGCVLIGEWDDAADRISDLFS